MPKRSVILMVLAAVAIAAGLAIVPNITFGSYNALVKACIHFGIYFYVTLGFQNVLGRHRMNHAWAAVISIAIAAADEILQAQNPSRSASLRDFLFDLAGVIAAMGWAATQSKKSHPHLPVPPKVTRDSSMI
jgi:VanZ family protein